MALGLCVFSLFQCPIDIDSVNSIIDLFESVRLSCADAMLGQHIASPIVLNMHSCIKVDSLTVVKNAVCTNIR